VRAARFHAQKDVRIEVGDGVDDLAVGDNVVVEPYFTCGECAQCLAGNYHLCVKMGFIGLAGGGGGLSEAIVVERKWIHKIGDIPLDEFITQGFDTLIHHNDTAVKILVHP
jgi:threonine dehydrogenase-like Zn-dependent dehydrogenase